MPRYRGVGWYSYDGSNQHYRPFARVVEVEADDPQSARERVAGALDALYEKERVSVDHLQTFIVRLPEVHR